LLFSSLSFSSIIDYWSIYWFFGLYTSGSFGEVGVMEFGLKGTSRLVVDVTGKSAQWIGLYCVLAFYGRLVLVIFHIFTLVH